MLLWRPIKKETLILVKMCNNFTIKCIKSAKISVVYTLVR